jgi:nucleoside-diphosphate-sugar epimerase
MTPTPPEPSFPPDTPVLVTGATGFTGSLLTRKLVARGARVRAIARPGSATDALKDVPVEWFRGQVFDAETVAAAAAGVAYIFHVAAAYREAKVSDEVYRNVHVASTQRLAEAARRNPGFQRFVHVSTVGVHGHIEHPPADENYPFHPGDMYQQTKAEAERWLRDFAARHGLPHTVIRPCAIYGPGDRRLFKVFKLAAGPVFPILGRGRCLYHLVHVEDLTNVLLLAAVSPAARGEVFIAGNPEPVQLENMARLIAECYGRRLRVLRLPVWPFHAAAAVCEAVCRPLGIEPPLYRRRVDFYTKDRAFDTRKLRERLGYQCVFTNETGMRETAAWYRHAGWL